MKTAMKTNSITFCNINFIFIRFEIISEDLNELKYLDVFSIIIDPSDCLLLNKYKFDCDEKLFSTHCFELKKLRVSYNWNKELKFSVLICIEIINELIAICYIH